jgi:catechol-2,3-dioxygenase
MTDAGDRRGPIVELTAVTLDCQDAAPMIAFYAGALDATVSHSDDSGAWIHPDGGPLVLIRVLDDFRRPTWPAPDVPMQMHLELSVDDVEEAEIRLQALGATTPEHQPHRAEGNVVMLDPAGHPFCIAARVTV